MSSSVKLRVVTPHGPVLDQVVSAVTACSEEGEFCVLPEHRPILASLKPGRLLVEADGENQVYAMDSGFFEGGIDHVNIMTQHCVAKADVVVEDVERELNSLRDELKMIKEENPRKGTLSSIIAWLEAQIDVAQD